MKALLLDYIMANEPAERRREAGEAANIIEPCESTVQAEKNSNDL